ncbi:SH2 domain-containing protein 3C isoform X2 [Lutzomyia longipalpis]|uniref:SH2 domain-containing protein 3C isoform X2 n=1 Tax=Lutzomyia longipalpis TaxID=7200 RepID=UPI002484622F|nr:SH2 domain-containing protein 3C isoform X2 [Lutzomyia longipalpis]
MDKEAENAQLKKALEWELSLDSRDLRSHAWYHGPIPRQRAEEIVKRDGDFLIRDCASQPGNFVLTCRTKSGILHFVINKVTIQKDTVYERVQYQFEDDAYDTVADLITFYVGSGKAVSAASGARIQFPCNRLYPLSFYVAKYTQPIVTGTPTGTPQPPPTPGCRYNPYNQQIGNHRSPVSSPPRTKRDVPPRLPSKKQRSQSLTPIQPSAGQKQEKYSSADGIINGSGSSEDSGSSIMTRSVEEKPPGTFPRNISSTFPRTTSCDKSLSPCMEQKVSPDEKENTAPSPPPKPARGLKEAPPEPQRPLYRHPSYHASGSDSGNGSGDSAQSSVAGEDLIQHRGVVIRNPRFIPNSASSVTLKCYVEMDPIAAEEALLAMDIPRVDPVSRFDVEAFETLLLPAVDNKPLDSGALDTFKMMLAENGPTILANHLTRVDIKLILGEEHLGRRGLECLGLEMITLPQGRQFRQDLIERTECLRLLVAVTILTCPTDEERTEILNKWILVALDTKTAMGNLFGFCGIMLGLCMPQIQRMEPIWHSLRQHYTESAFTFEAKLRPTLKSMNDCSNPQAPNTCLPHMLPYVLLKDRRVDEVLGQNPTSSPLISACIAPWESSASDFGLSIFSSHLDAGRNFATNLPTYRRNAQMILQDSSIRLDELLEDAFRTEFHMKFLWGSKGALTPAKDRHAKLEQILTLMSEKYCSTRQLNDPI